MSVALVQLFTKLLSLLKYVCSNDKLYGHPILYSKECKDGSIQGNIITISEGVSALYYWLYFMLHAVLQVSYKLSAF